MSESTVCFVNSTSENERIFVSDSQSAELLKKLLGRLENEKWVIEGEKPEVTMAPTAPEITINPRVKEFRVILISGSSSFRSTVVDITADSIKLRCLVPNSFSGKDCLVYVSHSGVRENVELACKIVEENGLSSLELISPKPADLSKIAEWMSQAN
jgi:hypothetical protein